MKIAVDFDGTIVEHKYPKIGKLKPFAAETLRQLAADGHKIILWTSREGELLEEAIRFCRDNGIILYAVNSDSPMGGLTFNSRQTPTKLIADLYIDDRNLGGLPDWGTIYEMISGMKMQRSERHRKSRSFKSLFRK